MTDLARALYTFWSGFEIPAYPENGVPDDAKLPYITYSISKPEWRSTSIINARVWYRDTSLVAISNKVDQISDAIGEGITLKTSNGLIGLFKDDNFLQFQPTEEMVEIKIAYLSVIIHALT